MDSSLEPITDVWGMLRDPLVGFFEKGMDRQTIDKILEVISNSCKYKKNWYVPPESSYPNEETCRTIEEQYIAFCTWLLGRFFYILGRDSLVDIHPACANVQITILQVCAKNRSMARFFFSEYILCLSDLLALQTSESLHGNGPQLLKRFTPLPTKALEDLNLMPKYILVKSQTHVNNLQKYVIEILDSMVLNMVYLHKDLVEDCWFVFCEVTQLATPHLKLAILSTFSKIISSAGCNSRTALAELCNTLKCVTQSIPNHLLPKNQTAVVQSLLSGIGDLVKVVVLCGCCGNDIARLKDLLAILHSVIFLWNKDNKDELGLKIACSNVIIILDALPHGSINADNFSFLMKRYETQENAVKIMERCMSQQLVDYVQSFHFKQANEEVFQGSSSSFSTHIDASTAIPLWMTLFCQLWDDIAALQQDFPLEPSRQKLQEINDLVGRFKSLLQCAVGVDIVCTSHPDLKAKGIFINFLKEQVGESISFFHYLLFKLTILKSDRSTVWFSESILKSIFLSLRYLFLLPEAKSASESEVEIAFSMLSIPWIKEHNKSDYKIDPQLAQVRSLFPEVEAEEMKILSLNAIAIVHCDKGSIWKLSVFNEIILSKEPKLLPAAIEIINFVPLLLMDQGLRPSEILNQLLIPSLHLESEPILTSVSEVFSRIVCILSGEVVPMNILGKNGVPTKSHVCLTCQKDYTGTAVGARNKLLEQQDVIKMIMVLLKSPIVSVRRNMAASLSSLVLHLPSMYKPDTVLTLMKYAEDPDLQVRLTFSRMVKFIIFSRDWMEGKEVEAEHLREEHIPLTQVDRAELFHSRPRLNQVLQMLFSALNSRFTSKDHGVPELQDTLLKTIVDIGCVPLDCVLLPVLKIVLLCVNHPSFDNMQLGQVYLKSIAIAHNTNVRNLYNRFQSDLCQLLVCIMGMNYHKRPQWTNFFNKVVFCFEFESTALWLRQSLKSVMPCLMVFVIKFEDNPLLVRVMELLRCSAAVLVKEYFQHIYPYVFLNESNEIVDKCVKEMEKMSNMKAKDLIISSFKTIHNELLLHYHCKKERVEEGICNLMAVLDQKGPKSELQITVSNTDIAKHLESRFLGVLMHYDSLLEPSNAEESSKVKALQSLPKIICLMGSKYITPVRFKVLSTLRTALRLAHCDFPHLSCGAWEAFIHSVDIHELGPLLGTIVASLMPLLEQFPEEVSSMLKWMVVKHENLLSDHIPDLFFLLNKPAVDKEVLKIVERHVIKRRSFYNESQNLADYLQQPLRFITHDNVDMRRHGLEHLLSLLKEKQVQFTRALLQEEVIHNDVAKLLSLLIEGCCDTDQDIRLLCVVNLGVLGAMDPGHLPHKKPITGTPQILSVNEDMFGVQALTVLAKGYQAARNTRYLDSFAVAIQVMLQNFNISSQPIQSGKNLWDSFPVSIQQVMAPLENSSYYMTSLQSNPIWPHPLFGTQYATSVMSWAHVWACRIVTFIEDAKAKEMFTICIPSLKTDMNCVLFFLPFLLLYAVISGKEDQHKTMAEELTYIIQQRSLRDKEGDESENSLASEKYQIRLDRFIPPPQYVDSDSTTNILCAKTVFTLLDFLEKWVGWCKKQTDIVDGNAASIKNRPHDTNVKNVKKFLNQFSKLDLAYGNSCVKEYARALMYLEDYLMENTALIKDQELLSYLGRIYAQMNEPDGIKGVLAIQCIQPALSEAVVYHEVADQNQAALACYELLGKQHSDDAHGLLIQMGMIRCYLNLDQPYAALQLAEGAILRRPECRNTFLEAQAECFWRIHNFEDLETILSNPKLEDSIAWGVSVGRCLTDIRHGNQMALKEHLCSTRNYLSKALSTASLENKSYLQGYSNILKLHMLQELEEASEMICFIQSPNVTENSCLEAVQNLVKVWEDRLAIVQGTASVQEQLLRLRRCLLSLATTLFKKDHYFLSTFVEKELGNSWLKSAEVARIGQQLQQAYIHLLNAEKYKPKRHFIELAKLQYEKSEEDHALTTLRRGLDEHFPNIRDLKNIASETSVDDRKICAEAKLMVAKYNDEKMNVNCETTLTNYREAVEVYPLWEKNQGELASYYDRLSQSCPSDSANSSEYQLRAICAYTKSLRFGCSLVYHNMSRMLTIWLEYGKRYHRALLSASGSSTTVNAKSMTERRGCLEKMNKFIGGHIDVLPSYMFMTGFSQLVSRICHPVADVYTVIKSIIVKLLLHFPQQTMWMLLVICRSSQVFRKNRCQEILDDPQIKSKPQLVHLTSDFVKLGNLLSTLCQVPVSKETFKTSVSTIVKTLPRLLASSSFSRIIVPLQRSLTLTLPQQDANCLTNYVPFPLKTPFISGIQEEVIILPSLQRPRKIAFRGSDGLIYEMMCKDKDDLRLDARVMEFNSIVNKYLQKDPASRARNLNIRTYSVVPLNEESGLIEWVPNLNAFRIIVTQLYKELGCFTSNREVKKFLLDKKAKLPEKRENFLKGLLPLHPPVFRNWFRNNFTDSRSWFEARKSYVRTLAVMSMVGYILGLGDRHGENILLDTTCGDVVHVDFNCLFNKGEHFECPERVPFRLTHNMVSAMGPTGVEGPFRHACEITLRLLRDMRQTLMSVLQPFVYDSKAEDPQTNIRLIKKNAGETTNDSAVENVKNIDLRLEGMMKKDLCAIQIQLSVEGQTAFLIQEATSIDNLCQMYIGWGAYI